MKAHLLRIKDRISADIHLAELLKGSGTAFVLRVLGLGFGYIFTLIITRGYGAEAMGIFALSVTVLQIASVIGRLGMDTALLRFVAEYSSQGKWDVVKNTYKKALSTALPFAFVISIGLFVLSPWLSNAVFHKPHLGKYFRIISIAIPPFVLNFIHTASLRGLKRIKEYMLLQQGGIFIIASLLLGILLLGGLTEHSTPVLTLTISIFIIAILSGSIWIKKLSLNNIKKSQKFLTYKELLSVSMPMLFSSSLFLVMQWTDTIMLGMFRTEQEVGIYNVALRVSMITSITLMAINTIAAPKFAEFWGKKDLEGLKKVAQQSTKLIFWTSFPVLLLFLLFPKPILGVFGEEFKAGAVALMILTIGQFVNAAAGSVGSILQMTGKQQVFQTVIFVASIINLLLNFILIPKMGILGAAVASMLSISICNIASWLYIKNTYGINTAYLPILNWR